MTADRIQSVEGGPASIGAAALSVWTGDQAKKIADAAERAVKNRKSSNFLKKTRERIKRVGKFTPSEAAAFDRLANHNEEMAKHQRTLEREIASDMQRRRQSRNQAARAKLERKYKPAQRRLDGVKQQMKPLAKQVNNAAERARGNFQAGKVVTGFLGAISYFQLLLVLGHQLTRMRPVDSGCNARSLPPGTD